MESTNIKTCLLNIYYCIYKISLIPAAIPQWEPRFDICIPDVLRFVWRLHVHPFLTVQWLQYRLLHRSDLLTVYYFCIFSFRRSLSFKTYTVYRTTSKRVGFNYFGFNTSQVLHHSLTCLSNKLIQGIYVRRWSTLVFDRLTAKSTEVFFKAQGGIVWNCNAKA